MLYKTQYTLPELTAFSSWQAEPHPLSVFSLSVGVCIVERGWPTMRPGIAPFPLTLPVSTKIRCFSSTRICISHAFQETK